MGQNVLEIRIFHVFFKGTAVCFHHCVFSLSSLCPGLCSAVSALRCFTTWQLSKHWMWLRHDPGSVRDSELYPKIVLQSKGLHFPLILTQRPGTCLLVKNSWSLTGDVVCVICIQKPENREHTKCVAKTSFFVHCISVRWIACENSLVVKTIGPCFFVCNHNCRQKKKEPQQKSWIADLIVLCLLNNNNDTRLLLNQCCAII